MSLLFLRSLPQVCGGGPLGKEGRMSATAWPSGDLREKTTTPQCFTRVHSLLTPERQLFGRMTSWLLRIEGFICEI